MIIIEGGWRDAIKLTSQSRATKRRPASEAVKI
jgi:hypothetical protein